MDFHTTNQTDPSIKNWHTDRSTCVCADIGLLIVTVITHLHYWQGYQHLVDIFDICGHIMLCYPPQWIDLHQNSLPEYYV